MVLRLGATQALASPGNAIAVPALLTEDVPLFAPCTRRIFLPNHRQTPRKQPASAHTAHVRSWRELVALDLRDLTMVQHINAL